MKIIELNSVALQVAGGRAPGVQQSIPSRIFQADEANMAGAFVRSLRLEGKISAAFIYTPLRPLMEKPMGALYVVFPEKYRVEFGKVEERYAAHSPVQGEQVCVWIKDTEIEEAVSYIVGQSMTLSVEGCTSG